MSSLKYEKKVLFPNYSKIEESPNIRSDFNGVKITAPNEINLTDDLVVPVFGVFQIPIADAKRIKGNPLDAVMLVVIEVPGHNPYSESAVKEAFILNDDIITNANYVKGYFSVDLIQHYQLSKIKTRYFVISSILEYTSNIIKIEIN